MCLLSCIPEMHAPTVNALFNQRTKGILDVLMFWQEGNRHYAMFEADGYEVLSMAQVSGTARTY